MELICILQAAGSVVIFWGDPKVHQREGIDAKVINNKLAS
jgi:hypothetical protein